MAAALLWVGLAQSAPATASIGPGGSSGQAGSSTTIGGSPISNTPSTTYTTNLGSLLGLDLVVRGLSSGGAGQDQLLADITRAMQDTAGTSQTTPRPAPKVDTLLAFVAAQLECTRGTFSCSSNSFVPGEFAGGVYTLVNGGCAQSGDPNICVSRLGQISISCTATVAAVCSTPGVPVVSDLFANATSVLEVQSYNNGALRIFVPTPVMPNSAGGSPEISSAVPEPATWAMMIVGFGMIGGAARQRRRTIVACA